MASRGYTGWDAMLNDGIIPRVEKMRAIAKKAKKSVPSAATKSTKKAAHAAAALARNRAKVKAKEAENSLKWLGRKKK